MHLRSWNQKWSIFIRKQNELKVEDENHANVPPLPINEMKVEKEDEKIDDWDEELTHWYNSENNFHIYS